MVYFQSSTQEWDSLVYIHSEVLPQKQSTKGSWHCHSTSSQHMGGKGRKMRSSIITTSQITILEERFLKRQPTLCWTKLELLPRGSSHYTSTPSTCTCPFRGIGTQADNFDVWPNWSHTDWNSPWTSFHKAGHLIILWIYNIQLFIIIYNNFMPVI